jgi:hypothetical protein
MARDQGLPPPYLSNDEILDRLEILGMDFDPYPIPKPGWEKQFQALQDIIAAAIASWVDLEVDDSTNDELQEWAQEFLIG